MISEKEKEKKFKGNPRELNSSKEAASPLKGKERSLFSRINGGWGGEKVPASSDIAVSQT